MRYAVGVLMTSVLVSACSQSVEPDAEGTADSVPVTATLNPGWNAFTPGGDTTCSDGSEYKFFARPGNPEKLMVYLQGGGACWSRETCDENISPSYNIRIGAFHPDRYRGIFEFDHPDNPLADYSVVFAPYCTGDVHLGASDTVYDPVSADGVPLTIHHQGFRNVQSVLDFAYQEFPEPKQIFVTGSSAGAMPSPYYAVQLAAHYPAARVSQLGDGAGGYRRSATGTRPHEAWGTLAVLTQHPAWAEEEIDSFNYERIYVGAAKYLPDVQFAEFDTAEDTVQKRYLALSGNTTTSLLVNLQANYADIRAEAGNFASYVAGGEVHTILARPEFYTYTVGDVSVRDWVADLVAGKPLTDLLCDDCRLPEFIGYPLPDALKELWLGWESPEQAVEPFQIFDNLYYVGIDWVAAYVLETSEGLILIDSLYGKWINPMLANIAKLGLDPNDIKYVLVTHGHFDHHGGAAAVQRRYGAKVVMTEEDWELAEAEAAHPLFAAPVPKRDIVAQDGDVITLGDTTVTLYQTPGHSPGVLTMGYQVKDGDDVHNAITLGGVGLNFSGVARTEQYLASYARLQSTADGVSVSLPNHAAMGRVFELRDELADRQPGEPHPFVNAEAYRAALALFVKNAEAKLVAEKAGTAVDPIAELTRAISD
ncbi:MAG: pectin acetylesterase-family hydrolase [Gammaproteobacteria bacterium]|nr:pectin acetylesterase-family hydrolase [Gammaproteobacteria bacterium]